MAPDQPAAPERDLAAAFERFAAWCEDTAPLYAPLARGVAGDPALLEVAAATPEGRSPPHLLLGAVHYLLLRGRDGALAEYYPSVTAEPRPPDDELPSAVREFVLEHEDGIRPVLRERRTQTNAVGRCAALYPAFARVVERLDVPPALVELGSSAGLNLMWDRYAYDYNGRRVGVADPPVVVRAGLRGGNPPLPADPPAVRSRAGVDLNPLDPADPDDADWLRALVWPEHDERRRRLDGALAVARRERPPVVAGDALERLPALLADVPEDVPVCVYHTLLWYQLPERDREALRATLVELGASRELHWVAGGGDADRDENALELRHGVVRDGELAVTRLATFEPHGRWLRWEASSE